MESSDLSNDSPSCDGCPHTHTHTHKHTHTHTLTHTHTNTHPHTQTHTQTHTHVRTRTNTRTHTHTGEAFSKVRLCAGDDAGAVAWTDICSDLQLYASHIHFIQEVAKLRNAAW